MSECGIKKLIDNTDDYTAIDRAVQFAEKDRRLKAGVRRAKEFDRYGTPDTRVDQYTDRVNEMVGGVLTLESIEGNTFEDIYIDRADNYGNGNVRINGDKLIKLSWGKTADGMYTASIYKGSKKLGSEDAKGIDKLIEESKVAKMSDVTGTVVQNLEDIVNKMLDKDGSRLSEEHQSHLMDVFSTYYSNLQEVGKDVKIDAELFEALDDKINTRGDADPRSGKIRLVLGNQVNHTLTEILAHEMQHTLLSKIISRDAKINTAIRKFRGEFRRHLAKKYNGEGWRVFMRDGITPEMAKEEYEYTIDNNTLSDMDEFLAAITTNESLVSELGTMTREPYELLSRPRDTSTKIGKMWDTLVQLINNAYDGFKKSISKSPREAREYAIHLLDTAMKAAHRDERETSKSWYDKTLEAISKGDSKIAEMTGEINKEHKTLKQHLEDKEQSAVNRVMSRVWKIRGLAKVRSMMLQNAVFSSVTRNMTNPYIAKFYEMFRHSKAFVEKEVVAMKNVTADVLDKKYGFGKLSKTTRKALKRVVIDLDAQVLGKAEDVLGYLKDEDKVTRELREIKKQLNPNSWGAVRELANLLVTNKMTKKNGYVNAAQIWMDYEDGKDTVDQIDKAATLMAIQMSSEHNKAEAIKGLEANLEGVDRVLEMVRASNKEVLEKAYDNNAMYEVKGAKQEVFGREGGIDKKHYLVDKKQMEELVKAGMYNIGKHAELSRVMGEDRYVVVGDSIEVAYTEGMMSVVQLKSEGDSLKAILLESGMLEEDVKKKIIGMARERGKAEEVMIPERTGDGIIYDYKIRLAHEVKEKYMEMDDDIIGVVASTISNLTHKQEAMINNKNAVTYFKKFYDENKESDEFKFIEISANSKGKYKEYWDLIPTYMKKTIAQHDTPLMIEEGLLVDMFGYKDVSMTQLPWVRDSVKRQLVAKKIETVVKEVTARWKKVMVAFTIATIKGNMTSNMLVAMQHTKNKNPVNYMSEFKDIWVEMNEYQDNRKKYVELEVRKKAGEKIAENEFKRLERAMHTSRVHDIMEDGQYNAILEDINTEYFDNKGMIESKIDELIKKASKGNDKGALKDFVDVLYIRKDSRQHDSIMKLTTFSDAINKVIILEDMKRSNDGEVTQEMLNYVDSLHVNYGYLDNRYVKYANDMGFLTFTKYFFRVIPAIAKMAGKKSISMLFTETAVNTTGLGETPMSQLWNPFDSLLRKFTLWGDPLDVGGAVINPAVL